MTATLKTVLVALATLSLCQVSYGDTAFTQAPAHQTIQEMVTNAQSAIVQMTDHVTHMLGFPDNPKEVFNTLFNQSQEYANNIAEFSKELRKQASSQSGNMTALLESMSTHWNTIVHDLKQKINETAPETTKNTLAVQKQFSESLGTITDEVKKVHNAFSESSDGMHEELAKLMKKVVQETKNAADTMQNRIHEVVGPHEPHDSAKQEHHH